MPVNKIYRGSLAAAQSSGGFSGFGVDGTLGRLYINRDGTREPIATDDVKVETASLTLTAADDGATVIADSTTSVVVTLPDVATCGEGVKFTLIVKQLTSSGGHAFSPAAADYITGNGLTAVVDKDLICGAAGDRVGDAITIVSDGVDGWFITSVVGTWAKEA